MSLLRVFVLRSDMHVRHARGFVDANWKAMADRGTPLSLTVAEHKAKRSNAQNALYWARLGEIAEAAWLNGRQFSRDAWHHHFGSLYLPKIETPGGELVPISTKELDVAAFGKYLDQIDAYTATELQIELAA